MFLYVDESKQGDYLMVAVRSQSPRDLRAAVHPLRMAGQRRIHMKHESVRRKRTISDRFGRLECEAVVYRAAGYRSVQAAREACLSAIVRAAAAERTDVTVVFELDEATVKRDDQVLIEEVRAAGARDRVRWQHARARDELALCVPDVIAWCWARGGEWKPRISGLVIRVEDV